MKVGLVFSVMNTLLELIVVFPDWYNGFKEVTEVLGVGAGVGATGVVITGATGAAVERQTEGCPEQIHPDWI